jgi:uncharacterized membrane protein YeaQ/YmgE (transglycosylase-associated protein family)
MVSMEDIAQMVPMLAMAGLIVAWLAQAFWRAGGYGLLPDMAVGLAGSAVAGALVWAAFSSAAGMLVMFGCGSAGAALAISAQRGAWHPAAVRS